MSYWQSQAHNIEGDQVHAALVELSELVKLQKGRGNLVPPHPEVSDPLGDRAKQCSVPPAVTALEPSIDGRQADHNTQVLSYRRSVLGRSLRVVAHGLIAFVIVGTAFAWRSSDNNTKEIIKAWGSSLAELSFIRAINFQDAIESSPNANVVPAELTSNLPEQGWAQNDVVMPAAPVIPFAATPGEASSEQQEQLATISGDLAAVKRTLEQLAAAQKHMAQDIAALQTAQQAINQKASLTLPPRILRRKNASTESRSERVVERNSEPVTTAPVMMAPRQPPLELH
jgi:hypothetical protein